MVPNSPEWALLKGGGDHLRDLVDRGAAPEAEGAGLQVQHSPAVADRQHRERAEHRDAGDRIGDILVAARAVTVLVAITAEAPQIDVPAPISSASLASTPIRRPRILVKAKVATSVAAITRDAGAPTCATCEAINCRPSRMMPSRNTRLRLKVTPGLAQAGVPKTL